MTDSSRTQGGLICAGVAALALLFLVGLLRESYWALAVPVAVFTFFVLGLSTRKCCDERARARPRSGRVDRQLLSTDALRPIRRYHGRPGLLIADRDRPFLSLL